MNHPPLEELYIQQLQDLYNSELSVAKKLPSLVQTASSPELKRAFEYCLEQTEENIHQTEQILVRFRRSASSSEESASFVPAQLRLVAGGAEPVRRRPLTRSSASSTALPHRQHP